MRQSALIAARWLFIAGTLFTASSCSLIKSEPVRVQVSEHPDPPEPPYLIGKDDLLNIVVWHEPQLSGHVTVNSDGTVIMPLIGSVDATDRTCSELQSDLTKRLRRFVTDPNITVRVLEARSRVFYALGEVNKPGVFTLHSDEVLSQALAQAGGLTQFADPSSIRILRHSATKDTQVTVNYSRIMKGKDLDADVELQPGDVVTVP